MKEIFPHNTIKTLYRHQKGLKEFYHLLCFLLRLNKLKILLLVALDFKSRFRIHKSDIKTKKDRCGTARHFNTKCTDSSNPHKFLKAM